MQELPKHCPSQHNRRQLAGIFVHNSRWGATLDPLRGPQRIGSDTMISSLGERSLTERNRNSLCDWAKAERWNGPAPQTIESRQSLYSPSSFTRDLSRSWTGDR
ncbi:hypothetical protein AAFF_G00288140 [Aldrovandia affinis]|uniref:Uncharacterized protein n=1 Tax=Aldrovandia affinis TaxID=143900 RepID=A0AAD7SR90_9TELE|nr:hypothetical protein AAFF_G00288140 [Aldrovandia affinis]